MRGGPPAAVFCRLGIRPGPHVRPKAARRRGGDGCARPLRPRRVPSHPRGAPGGAERVHEGSGRVPAGGAARPRATPIAAGGGACEPRDGGAERRAPRPAGGGPGSNRVRALLEVHGRRRAQHPRPLARWPRARRLRERPQDGRRRRRRRRRRGRRR